MADLYRNVLRSGTGSEIIFGHLGLPRALLGEVKACPKCGLRISKTPQSCNKMKCRCGMKFCWVCLAKPDARGMLKCGCPKTGNEHGFYEDIGSYRPSKRQRQT